jgi:hypothetical protein
MSDFTVDHISEKTDMKNKNCDMRIHYQKFDFKGRSKSN